MCTVDPYLCWYLDHKKFWEEHPKEYERARALLDTDEAKHGWGNADQLRFLWRYAQFRRMINKVEEK